MSAGATGEGEVLGAMLWVRDDGCALEHCQLRAHTGGFVLAGTALCSAPAEPARVDYRVRCDGDWVTHAARVVLHRPGAARRLELARGPGGDWRIDGAPLPGFADCTDLDLEFTPATNTIAVRRLALGVGESAACRALWLRYPALTAECLLQRYTRTATLDYSYASGDGTFHAALRLDACGLVRDYAGLWHGVPA